MEKGCFISVIVFLTLVVIAVFYLVKFHGEELIELGTQKLVEIAEDDIQTKIEGLEKSKYADSLKIVVGQYFKDLKEMDIENELKRLEEFSDDIEVILMDSEIDSAEFDFITNILTKYEKRKEN